MNQKVRMLLAKVKQKTKTIPVRPKEKEGTFLLVAMNVDAFLPLSFSFLSVALRQLYFTLFFFKIVVYMC